jgi:hypothetical protein
MVRASTTTAVSSSANPALPGQSITFTATVNPVVPGSGTPTGTVQFKIDGSPSGSPVALSSGRATLSTSSLTHGTHSIAAEYTGDINFFGSTNSLSSQLVNTSPTAGPDSLARYGTNAAKIAISDLLKNDSDVDGDSLSFISVTNASVAGGVVARTGNWIFYTPPANSTTGDSFTYTVADNLGGAATGTVNVVIGTNSAASDNLAIQSLGGSAVRLLFDGIPGRTYSIQFSTNVTLGNWQTLANIVAGSSGFYTYTDSPPAGVTRIYRSIQSP